MRIDTYQEKSQTDLELDDEEWGILKEYVDKINDALKAEATDIGGTEEVEEDPPSITDGTFNPGGWVGMYPCGVTVEPSHFSQDEYEQVLSETQRWVEIIGATTIETAFPLTGDFLIDNRTKLAAYSRALIELSEAVRSKRLPVEVQRQTTRGFDPSGRPMFGQTMQEQSRGSQYVVSERVNFSFDTLLNHILVRFHIELLTEMQELAAEYPYYRSAFSAQINYHEDFVNTGIPGDYIDKAVESDLTSPSVLAKARHDATGEMAEVVDLWEAFHQDIATQLTLSNRLNSAVKPMSKVYELWCLGTILQILTNLTDREPEARDSIEKVYDFGGGLKLHYNNSFDKELSKYFRDNLGVGPGKPDFALEYQKEIYWVGDAKFKTTVSRRDYVRFISYLIDLVPPDRLSTILYVSDAPRGISYIRDYPIDHVSLRPARTASVRVDLVETFGRVLRSINVI